MKKIKENNESYNLMFVVFLYVIITIAVLLFIVMEINNYKKVEESINRHDEYLKDIIFMSTFDSLKKGNMKLFNQILEEVGSYEDVVEFSLIKPDGKVSYSSNEKYVGNKDEGVLGIYTDMHIVRDGKSHFYFPVVSVPYCIRCHTEQKVGQINSYYKFVMKRKAQEDVLKISSFSKAFIILSGFVIGFLIYLIYSIFDKKRYEKQLEKLAYYDSLTGLPNRKMFNDRLEKAIAMAERQRYNVAVMFLDLDDFKSVNDTLGHNAGDLFLRDIAERLKSVARTEDTVARLGGDEFIIILNNIHGAEGAGFVAGRILESFKSPFKHEEKEIFPGASIGISIYPDDGKDCEDLLLNADIAMYDAKKSGKGNYSFFRKGMDECVKRRLKLEESLSRQNICDDFYIEYQPVIDLKSNKVSYLEAYIRWKFENEIIYPNEFISILEKNGRICEVGYHIFDTVCKDLFMWKSEGYSTLKAAMNLSVRQLVSSSMIEGVKKVIEKYDLQFSDIIMEIKESYFENDLLLIKKNLNELTALGVIIALDDFGTGYSSLNYLKDFPISNIKIDNRFVTGIQDSPNAEELVKAIVKLANTLGMSVTAEGVETRKQNAIMCSSGCRYVQGYYYAKPEKAEKISEYLKGKCDR